MTADLEARVENAVSRALADAGWYTPLSIRGQVAKAVMAVIEGQGGEPRGTGCCKDDGIDCVSCMTGRCTECRECVHYDDSRDDRDDEEEENEP